FASSRAAFCFAYCCHGSCAPRDLHSFPTRRSSDLSCVTVQRADRVAGPGPVAGVADGLVGDAGRAVASVECLHGLDPFLGLVLAVCEIRTVLLRCDQHVAQFGVLAPAAVPLGLGLPCPFAVDDDGAATDIRLRFQASDTVLSICQQIEQGENSARPPRVSGYPPELPEGFPAQRLGVDGVSGHARSPVSYSVACVSSQAASWWSCMSGAASRSASAFALRTSAATTPITS